jgi:hypothetical protein
MVSRKKFGVINGGKGKASQGQLSLFGQGDDLENRVSMQLVSVNKAINYGITFEELASFQSKPDGGKRTENYYGIQKAWRGMNNMESFDGNFGVSHNMLTMMKAAEIVALYIGIGQAKINNAIGRGEKYNLGRDAEPTFGRIVNDLVNIGYEHHGVKVMSNKKSNKVITVPLVDRMNSISFEEKKRFIESVNLPYRKTGTTTKQFDYEFRDPHPENKADYTGINIYRRHIADFIQVVYNKNILVQK